MSETPEKQDESVQNDGYELWHSVSAVIQAVCRANAEPKPSAKAKAEEIAKAAEPTEDAPNLRRRPTNQRQMVAPEAEPTGRS